MDSDVEVIDATSLPWYRQREGDHPFKLLAKVSNAGNCCFHAVASFPWDTEALKVLWNGNFVKHAFAKEWPALVKNYSKMIAIGSGGVLFVLSTDIPTRHKPLAIKLPEHAGDVKCVSWALHDPREPLVIFAASSILYIVNVVRRKIIGYLRGHGGAITSIATHPTQPYIVCTTSRDFTTRIYDLTMNPCEKPNNPPWPPRPEPSRAGAGFGLHMHEKEGPATGIGRCVAVLVGGRSGGHQAAVLGAAFHPRYPMIATCGMDRAVKIWRIPESDGKHLAREDKPLFSSNLLHKARVLSISWLNSTDDVLLSHCAPALMRAENGQINSELYEKEGRLVLWKWLALDRFFPPERGGPFQSRSQLRGCASDYQESSSFKYLSVTQLPMAARYLHTYQHRAHDPLVLLPVSNTIMMVNVTHLPLRKPPPFPLNEEEQDEEEVVEMTSQMRLSEEPQGAQEPSERPRATDSLQLFESVGWKLDSGIVDSKATVPGEELRACVMRAKGREIVGVGSKGTIWVWNI